PEMSWELMRVEAVAVLVHRREERLHRLRVVVGRDPDVVDTRARCERVLRGIESPRVGAEAELGDDLLRDYFLAVDGKVPGHDRVVDLDVAELCKQRDELRLELGKDL